VVEFVALVRHLDRVDQFTVRLGVRIHVDDADEVGAVDIYPDPERHHERRFLAVGFGPRRRRRRIARPIYLVVFVAMCVG
jgi:hypothetical protein